MLRNILASLCVLSLVGLSGCGSDSALKAPAAVSIDLSLPANTTLLPGQTAQFSASVSNASNTSVIWEVNNVVGGNSQLGTITTGGLYTAPSTFPSSALRKATAATSTTVTITAAAEANTSASATATVTLLAPPTVSVSPTNPSVYVAATQQFTATVTNSSNSAVVWQVNGVTGGSASTGTISASGLFTAPATVPNPSAETVTAIAAADSAVSASTTVTILALPPVVKVTPSSVSVPGNTTQQFSASVTNTSNTAVTWEVNNIPGGNTTTGTISQTGLYTAPAAIPNPAVVTVSAVSAANSSSVGSASVTITTPEVVVVTPASVTLEPYATQQFSATSSIPNDTLTWQVNGVTGGGATDGTITSAGLFTAPSAAPSNPVVVIKAISGMNPAIFGSSTATIGNTPPSVSVSPGSVSVVINTKQQFSASVLPANLSQVVQWKVNNILGGNATVGTICNAGDPPPCVTGQYTAPLLVPNPAGVTVTAVSTAVPTALGSASVTVTLPSSPISVTVTPPSATVIVGQSQAFSAAVSPNNNPAVTWTVSSSQFGCTASASNACGSISTSGNYTAPMAIPGGGQSADVTITATSAADPTKSGTATATITPVPTPTVSITPCCGPNTPTSGSIAFSATLQNAPADTQINWFLGCASNDEGDVDECTDDDNDNTPPLPPAKIDGPGLMVTANAIQSDTVITNASSITYYAPSSVYQPLTASVLTLQMATKIQSVSLPTIAAYPCSLGTSNTEYVPIAAYINVNGTYYLSQWACIQVTGP